MLRVAREVFLTIDAAVVPPAGLLETDAEPRAGGELRAAYKANHAANITLVVTVADRHDHLVLHLKRHLLRYGR